MTKTATQFATRTPESAARDEFVEGQANYERAKSIVVSQLTEEAEHGNNEGLTFGELVRRMTDFGIAEHLASQALDAMRGRKTAVSSRGLISLRSL